MLESYKNILAVIAGFITITQMFSGLFICKDIYKIKSTKNSPSMPFLGGVAISILFFQHGLLMKDKATGVVNLIGFGMNASYVLFYYLFSSEEDKRNLIKNIKITTAVIVVLIGYAQYEDPQLASARFGTVVTILLLLLIAGPLFQIKTIIQTKSSQLIPLPMVITGTLTNFSWLLYGLAANQNFIVYQNIIALLLCFPQLILCMIYPSKVNTKIKL